jgi:hypothetical protein
MCDGKSSWEDSKQFGSNHYKTGSTEPADLLLAGYMFHDFALGNIIKYAFRCRMSGPRDYADILKDMDKVIDYAQKLKAQIEVNRDQEKNDRSTDND